MTQTIDNLMTSLWQAETTDNALRAGFQAWQLLNLCPVDAPASVYASFKPLIIFTRPPKQPFFTPEVSTTI